MRRLCLRIGSRDPCATLHVTVEPETCMLLIEHSVKLMWYTLLVTQNGEVLSLWLVSRIFLKDTSTRGIKYEHSDWGVISLYTGQSAVPVILLCCHAVQITPKFTAIQPHCMFRSCRKIHIFAIIHTVFCIVVMLGRSQPLQRCNAQSLVASQWPRCIKACILILPHWCYINAEHWDATMVLPCSSAAQSSYNDSHNDNVGKCATHIGKAVMLKHPLHNEPIHVYVAYSRVSWWYYILQLSH